MLTKNHRKQMKQQIGQKHGLLPAEIKIDCVTSLISASKFDFELEVEFSHMSGFAGIEIFDFDVSDIRKSMTIRVVAQ